MTIRYINTGTSANKGDGDSLRTAFNTINQNFSYISTSISTITNDLIILDQSIYGTITNRNIEILPSGTGTVLIPTIETSYLTINTGTESTIEFVGLVEYDELIAYSFISGTVLSTGTYGINYAIPAPYGVSSLGGDPEVINKIQVGDILSSADTKSYPVVGRGTSTYYNYVVVDLTNYQLAPTPERFTEVHITRPLDRTFTKLTSKPGTGIILDTDGAELQIRGSVIPLETATETHLGLPDRRWSDLWVGLGSVHLLDETYNRDLKIGAKNGNFTIGNAGIEIGDLIIHEDHISATTSTKFLIGTNTEILSISDSGISLSPGTSITFGDGTVQTTANSGASTGTLTFSGHIIPTANLTYDLGSTSSQWRSLYVGTSTIYLGGTALSVNPGGSLTINGDTVQGLPTITVPREQGSTYKGLQVSYGMIHSNGSTNELNVNKIVIYKPAVTVTTIDPTSSQDNFQVSGLSDSDVLAMFILYGDVNGPKPVSTLQAFAEAAIDTVILNSGVEGQYNTVDQMKTAFYGNYQTLSTAAGGLYQDFQFFITNLNTLGGGVTTTRQGSGAVFDVSNNGDGTYSVVSIVNSGTNYLPGHKINISGADLGATSGAVSAMIVTNGPNLNWSTTSIQGVLPGLEFLFTVDGSGNATVSNITDSGSDRNVGDTFTILGTSLGLASPADDVNFEVTAISFSPNDAIITITSATETSIVNVDVAGTAPGTSSTVYTNLTGTNYQVGSGYIVANVSYSNNAINLGLNDYGNNYVVGDIITLPGELITGGTTSTNDLTITVTDVNGGSPTDRGPAYVTVVTGLFPQVWPEDSISDGGVDQYDTANFISTNLAADIAYNGGNTVVNGVAAFGTGSSYSFVYNTGTFALFATGTNVTLIRTSGNSGADGNSVTEAGNIYGPDISGATYDNAVTHINIVGDPYAGPIVSFTHSDNGDEVDILILDDGDGAGVGITRSGNGNGIYNPYREGSWNGSVSPDGTLWNIDGWDDLSDVETRTYLPLLATFGGGGLGNKIVGTECVMYLPDNGKYYAVKFDQWTQNNNGGGFAYTRRELDLNSLQEGIRFTDGTVLKSAEGIGRVKLSSPGNRRIEEVYGYKQVSLTQRITTDLTSTLSRNGSGEYRFWINASNTTIDDILNNTTAAGITDFSTIQFSLDQNTWYTWNGSISYNGDERGYGVDLLVQNLNYGIGDTVYFRYKTGGDPVVWWDKADLPSGGSNFRGAIIDYHAYDNNAGTIVGTIHIVNDDGDENVAHTEVASGGSDTENVILWLQDNESQLKVKRIDGSGTTVKIQWAAKIFYGSEIWD